jgi:hypothetical protein
MSVSKGIAALALAASGVLAGSASAAPFLNMSLLGRVQGSGAEFGPSVTVSGGETVEYQVQIQLAPEGTNNTFAGPVLTQTIVDWRTSNGSAAFTTGLNNVRYSLTQDTTPGTIQTNFTSGSVGTVTGNGTWGVALGSSPGTLTPRGNGNNNLVSVGLNRENGNFDGIGENDVPELLTIANGVFTVASGGNETTLKIDLSGIPSGIIAGYRWLNVSGGNVNYTQSVAQQNASFAANPSNPIINYTGLALVPEPATVGLIGLAAAGMGLRRRRSSK